jgi:hypothetical protein
MNRIDSDQCVGVDPRPEVWFLTSELEGARAPSFRQTRWCEVFLRAGARIVIMNARGSAGLTVREFESEAEFAVFRKHVLASARSKASVRTGATARVLRRIKHLLLVDFFFPNLRRIVEAGRHRLAQSTGPIAIMASSPSFSLAVAGARIKRAHPDRVQLLVDMRDAWALHRSLGGPQRLKREIEGRVFQVADRVMTVSAGLKEEFDQTYGLNTDVMYNVATHYRESKPSASVDWRSLHPQLRPNSVKIAYTGSTPEGFYDIGAIVAGRRIARRSYGVTADALQLVFVGACAEVERELARQRVDDGECVLLGHQSHIVAQTIQSEADALLFIGYDGPGNSGVVSTKLFEYLALEKPILPIGLQADSDVDVILRTTCGSSLVVRDADGVGMELAAIASGGVGQLPRLRFPARMWSLVAAYESFACDIVQSLRDRDRVAVDRHA